MKSNPRFADVVYLLVETMRFKSVFQIDES